MTITKQEQTDHTIRLDRIEMSREPRFGGFQEIESGQEETNESDYSRTTKKWKSMAFWVSDDYISRKPHYGYTVVSQLKEKPLSIKIGQTRMLVPIVFKDIYNEIEKSRYMLEFEDDWDDEGSSKYEIETWEKAMLFLINYSTKIYDQYNEIILAPSIFHSINGSIDLLWKNKQYQLLINIPKDVGPAKFYGDNFEMNSVEGSFDTSTFSVGLMLTLLDHGNVAGRNNP